MQRSNVLVSLIIAASLVGCAANEQVTVDPKTETVDVEGAFKTAPAALATRAELAVDAAKAEAAGAPVKASQTSDACIWNVVEKSAAAVGQPCLTTREFMKHLGLTDQQMARVEKRGAPAASSKKLAKSHLAKRKLAKNKPAKAKVKRKKTAH